MDLPFMNNEPPAENAGADFWNFGGQSGEGGDFGDDVTLNELLALYQSANEAAPPVAPISEPEAYPVADAAPAEAPAPFVPPEPVQSTPWDNDAVAGTPYVPAEPIQSNPWEADRMAPPQPMAWENAGDNAAVPMFDIPSEPIFAAPPVEPAPVETPPVFEPEPLFPEPAPIVVPEPVVELAPIAAPPIEVKKVVSVATAIKVQPVATAMAPVGEFALATPKARQEASGKIGTIAAELAQGIDAVQEQLNAAYEQLATAAASRAPVTDIVSITSSLSEIKGQISEESPVYRHALALRQMADAYLELLKSL